MLHPDLDQALRTDKPRPLHTPGGRDTILRTGGRLALLPRHNFQMLGADNDLHIRIIHQFWRQEEAEWRIRLPI